VALAGQHDFSFGFVPLHLSPQGDAMHTAEVAR